MKVQLRLITKSAAYVGLSGRRFSFSADFERAPSKGACPLGANTLARKRATLSLGIIPKGILAFRPEYFITGLLAAAALVGGIALLPGCLQGGKSKELREINVGLSRIHGSQFAGLYRADQHGCFQIKSGGMRSDSLQLLSTR